MRTYGAQIFQKHLREVCALRWFSYFCGVLRNCGHKFPDAGYGAKYLESDIALKNMYLKLTRKVNTIIETVKLHQEFMPTPVMTIVDLTENINVTQSENKYHPPFHLKNLPKLAEHGWYLWRHKREKASKSRLRPIGNAQILRCTCVS